VAREDTQLITVVVTAADIHFVQGVVEIGAVEIFRAADAAGISGILCTSVGGIDASQRHCNIAEYMQHLCGAAAFVLFDGGVLQQERGAHEPRGRREVPRKSYCAKAASERCRLVM